MKSRLKTYSRAQLRPINWITSKFCVLLRTHSKSLLAKLRILTVGLSRYGEWVKGEKPLEQFVEDNDADKMAILYRRPDGSGHCVVYDADLQKSQGSGFVDFQSSANPAGFEKDGDQYIEDQAVSYFLIKKKEV